jgi:enterochelin esterase family protein
MSSEIMPDALLASPERGSVAWWELVRQIGTPLCQSLGDGRSTVTFLWRDPDGGSERSLCRRVYLDVYSHTPHPTRQLTSMERVGDSDVWLRQTCLPDDWCGSYFLMPANADQLPPDLADSAAIRCWWIDLMARCAGADPLNRQPAHAGGWGHALSPLRLRAAHSHPAWCVDDDATAPKVPLIWHSTRLDHQRRYWLHCTASQECLGASKELPLVVLLDGHYWALQMPIFSALDRMTAARELPPAVYLFIDAVDPARRAQDLPCNRDFWLAVQEELLPTVRRVMPFADDPRRTLIAGQSYGGLAALYAALHWPQRFAKVLSQSGSFWWPGTAADKAPGWLTRQVRVGQGGGSALQVVLEVGCYEPDMIADHGPLRMALTAAGHQVHYREFRGGHDWLCWRDGLLAGLAKLMNPDLWNDNNEP